MADIEFAKNALEGHSIALCRNGEVIVDDGRGISPMMKLIASGADISGYSAADLIVGKAAAMLFVKAGIVRVHGKVMSEAGKRFLESHGIACTYDTLTERIINRAGDDICPMEKAVADINDAEEGYSALKRRIEEMRASRPQ